MTMCLINDCTGFESIAPCCLHCPLRPQCPDRCKKNENTFCVGVLNDNDCKGIPQKNNQDTQRDR